MSRHPLGGRFVLEREIGAGGMSIVFLGRDEVLDRPVAVKVLKEGFEGNEVSVRFRREGRTAARLSHPNVVQVYDAGEDELDGRKISYVVMEYVPGGDLKRLVDEKGPLGEKELARIGADVASGLAHAHGKGIVHRDIKPQNILIDDYGRPKLADFGVARALDAETAGTSSYLGTASYSSPEQLRGEGITPKSDVYSFGCTLYEAAVGEPPFSGAPIATANQQLTKSPAPPRTRGANLSKPFEALVLDCLAKEPADRPDAAGLQERLLRLSAAASGAAGSAASGAAGGLAGAAQELGAVARGLRDRANPARTPDATTQALRRKGRRGRRVALVAAGAVGAVALLVLALVGAATVAGMPTPPDSSGTGEETQQQAADSGVQSVAEPPASTTEETTAAPAAPPKPPSPPSKAEEAVYDMYVKESYQDPNKVWPYLSRRLQGEVGSPERWAEREQLGTLRDVYFTQMPNAQLSGETAEVSFRVREYRTGGPRLVGGTWECVNEGGEWKLDRLVESGA